LTAVFPAKSTIYRKTPAAIGGWSVDIHADKKEYVAPK